MFRVDVGIMGAAYERSVVLRTKHYDSDESFYGDLRADMRRQGDKRDPGKERRSWLAIPFLGSDDKPALVLFADASELNFFATQGRTRTLVDMCWGFCRLIDKLVEHPFATMRNFGFKPGRRITGGNPMYETVQEEVLDVAVPRFTRLQSFNFETSVG